MKWNILDFSGRSIYDQLQLEEALLRADDRNWCIINHGVPPAIVLGISAKIEEVVDQQEWEKDPVPILRRFSGGGTVVVDEGTCFATFICNAIESSIPPKTRDVLSWSGAMYAPILGDYGFRIEENDYVLQDRKVGGNAQYLCRHRWLHHTTFLWSWHPERMRLLKHPPKEPVYRKRRSHEEFLIPLQRFFSSPCHFLESCLGAWKKNMDFVDVSVNEAESLLCHPHRKTTARL